MVGLMFMENAKNRLCENMHLHKTVCMVWMNTTLF